jgi:hypothetical protein
MADDVGGDLGDGGGEREAPTGTGWARQGTVDRRPEAVEGSMEIGEVVGGGRESGVRFDQHRFGGTVCVRRPVGVAVGATGAGGGRVGLAHW